MTEKELCRKYVGVPYEHQGRTLEGLDCWGLIILAYREIGVEVLDLTDYDYDWAQQGDNHFVKNYYENWQRVEAPCFMDLLMFSNPLGIPYHAGIHLGYGRFLQCALRVGVVITPLDDKWRQRLYGVYRYVKDKDK